MDPRSVLILGSGGYIGSALIAHLRVQGLNAVGIDNGFRAGPETAPPPLRDFRDLTAEELAAFGAVVLLAGHSSVGSCDREPREAFANNVDAFAGLVHKLRGQKLLFASSISLFIRTPAGPASESQPLPPAVSYYDLHKQMIEQYARIGYPHHYYALRFGTLCGPSPNTRWDLLLNSLVKSALTRRQLHVSNRGHHRPILGIGDLCRAITALVTQTVEPGPYNVASTNVTIGQVADYVAGRFGVPCVEEVRPTLYNIEVSTEKFTRATGLSFADTVPSLVDDLAAVLTPSPGDGR